MKKAKVTLSMAFAVFALLTPAVAENWALRADIPFEFTVGQQTLRAGEYCVSANDVTMLRMVRTDGSITADVETVPIRGPNRATPGLTFHRYGKQYFLAEVWVGESISGRQLFVTAAELDIARAVKQETTTIVAKPCTGKAAMINRTVISYPAVFVSRRRRNSNEQRTQNTWTCCRIDAPYNIGSVVASHKEDFSDRHVTSLCGKRSAVQSARHVPD